MDQEQNRVAVELEVWRKREERFTALFPNALTRNRGFQLEKLAHLEAIGVRYRNTQNQDERMTLHILEEQRKELEKRLYPNLLYRLVRRLIVSSVIRNRELKRADSTGHSIEQVKEVLRDLGMKHLNNRLEEQLKSGIGNVKIPFINQLNEREKLAVEVSINKDQHGQYSVAGYNAKLQGPGKEVRTHYFKKEEGLLVSADQSYQLLSGRSVEINNTGVRQWVQLDLNDKDAAGNYRVKQFSQGLDFDLEGAVKKLPVIQLPEKLSDLLKDLSDGKRIDVMIKNEVVERKLSIEANPQSRGIIIYDESGKKISLESALKEKANPVIVALKPNQNEKTDLKTSARRKI